MSRTEQSARLSGVSLTKKVFPSVFTALARLFCELSLRSHTRPQR